MREIIETHKNDERICMWDIYDGVAGNSKREQATMPPNLKKFFEIAREIDPIQPLTCCAWRLPNDRSADDRYRAFRLRRFGHHQLS